MKFLLYIFVFLPFLLFAQEVQVSTYAYAIDRSNMWTADDAYAQRESFTPVSAKNRSLGFKKASIWIYIKVKNLSPSSSKNVIVFAYPQHDNLDVYKYNKGRIETSYVTGDLHPFDTRVSKAHNFVIPYTLEANTNKEILIKIRSNSSLNIGANFYTAKEYEKFSFKDSLFLAIYYSIVFIIIFHNLMLYFIIKERVYLDYATFHTAYFFLHFSMNGLSFAYLYPDYPWLNLYIVPFFFILSNYLAIRFTCSYLSLEHYEKRIAYYFSVWMRFFFALLVLSFILPYAFISELMTVLSVFNIIVLLSVAMYVWHRHRTSSAKFFLLGWGILLLGAIVTVMQNLGIIPMNTLTNYSAQIGAIFELTILSLHLAYNYTLLFQKSLKREEMLKTLTQTLEKKVAQRTSRLEEKNKELVREVNNKNILLKELYHRVKNNLQIVSSLLSLQSLEVEDSKAKNILLEMTNRIKSIAFIHEKLYQSSDLTEVEMQHYVESLVQELQKGLRAESICFDIFCHKIKFSLEKAVPLGLIINELVTNSIKYAFTSDATNKTITIMMQKTDAHTCTLHISDNGKGADIDNIKKGFGYQLVDSVVHHQLHGKIESHNNTGLIYTITFNTEEKK